MCDKIDEMLAAFEDDELNDGNSLCSQNSSPKTKRVCVVPLNFEDCSGVDSAESSSFTRRDYCDSEDEENEIEDCKRTLTSSGRELKSLLDKVEKEREGRRSLSQLVPKNPVPKSSVVATLNRLNVKSDPKSSNALEYDPFFRFKIRSPKVSSEMFETLCEGTYKQKLCVLNNTNVPKGPFITMGVLIDKTETRKSANGNEYIVWKLHDLKDPQQLPVRCLLFGEAFKIHYKLMVGVVVVLVSPALGDSSEKDKLVTLKAVRPAQIIDIGWSADFGKCRGLKPDGSCCHNFVNVSISDFCVFHVMAQARKLSSKRGTFNAVSGAVPVRNFGSNATVHSGISSRPGKGAPLMPVSTRTTFDPLGAMKAVDSQSLVNTRKTVDRQEEHQQLHDMISSRAHVFGAKNLVRLEQLKSPAERRAMVSKIGSMTDFIKEQVDSEDVNRKEKEKRARLAALRNEVKPRLAIGPEGFGPPGKAIIDNGAARKRAAEVLKRSRESLEQAKGKKRLNTSDIRGAKKLKLCDESTALVETKVSDDILTRKSKFSAAADKAENAAVQKYLTNMEAKEKVEAFVTTTMSVRDVSVVSCRQCRYTAQAQSELCRNEGHSVVKHKAEKRFFKCKECKKRTTAFGFLPKKPCACGCQDWERVAMRDERRVQLETEKLLLRGEERTFVNC